MFLIVAKMPNKKQSRFLKHRLEFNQVRHFNEMTLFYGRFQIKKKLPP